MGLDNRDKSTTAHQNFLSPFFVIPSKFVLFTPVCDPHTYKVTTRPTTAQFIFYNCKWHFTTAEIVISYTLKYALLQAYLLIILTRRRNLSKRSFTVNGSACSECVFIASFDIILVCEEQGSVLKKSRDGFISCIWKSNRKREAQRTAPERKRCHFIKGRNYITCLDETTAPSTVAASGTGIGPERHVIAEGYRLVMWLGRWTFCLMTTLTLKAATSGQTDVCPRSSNAIGPERGGLQICDLTRSYNFI